MIFNIPNSEYFFLFLIISLGLLFGRLKISSISLDFSAVIFVALIIGHFGFELPKIIQDIGLLLFIFTIGIQSGPGFLQSFKRNGLKFILLTFIIVSIGFLLSLASLLIFKINTPLITGIFNGALTSTPGLAAAIEATHSPNAAIGYGIAYPVGVLGVVLFITLAPKLFRFNIQKSEFDYDKSVNETLPNILTKNFLVENFNATQTIFSELKHHKPSSHCIVVSIHRKNEFIIPKKDTFLKLGDVITVIGRDDEMIEIEKIVGKEVDIPKKETENQDVQWFLVTNKSIVNKSLATLKLFENYNASIAVLKRSGIDISPDENTHLRFGDRLLIAADKSSISNVAQLIGNDDKRLSETDFLPITLGILLGILLGSITINFFNLFNFSLGITGGVLLVALTLSGIGKTGPIIWTMSSNSNMLIREFGLLMFLSAVGCNAGSHLTQTIHEQGFSLFVMGAIITIVPILVGWFIGYKIFKINPLALLGLITGGMTSTPGLGAASKLSSTNIPQIAYATVYPFALVLMIIFSKLLSLF